MKIKGFPHDGRMWRINWLGGIDSGTYERSLTELTVTLSPIADPTVLRFSKEAVTDEIKEHCISIGHLPFLKIGSLYNNGILMETDIIPSEIDIFGIDSPQTPNFISASKLIRKNRYFLDKDTSGETQCLLVNNVRLFNTTNKEKNIDWFMKKQHNIIIPCPEIARFYFATSSTLIRKLIHGAAMKLDDLVVLYSAKDKCKTGVLEGNVLYLNLRRNMLDSDAWVIARIIGNYRARREAQRLYSSLLENGITKKPVRNLQVSFPFDGKTKLKCKGFWTKTIDDQHAFLALNIISCTGEFPYNSLIIDRENSNRVRNHDGEKLMGYRKTYYKPINKGDSGHENQVITGVGKEHSKEFLTTSVKIQEDRFLALKNKKITKRYKMNAEYKTRSKNVEEKEVVGYEAGAGDPRKGKIAPIEFILASDANNSIEHKELIQKSLLRILWQAMHKIMRRSCRFSVVVVDTGERTTEFKTSTFPLTYLRTWGTHYSKWAPVYEEGKKRGRQALWIEFERNGIWSYVVEWEQQGKDDFGIYFLKLNNGMKASNEELRKVMELWAADKQYRLSKGLKRGWIRETIKHPSDTIPLIMWPKIIANRIHDRLYK